MALVNLTKQNKTTELANRQKRFVEKRDGGVVEVDSIMYVYEIVKEQVLLIKKREVIDIQKVRKKGIKIHAFIFFLAPSFGGYLRWK